MTDFDRAAAEQTLKDAGAKKAKNSGWWTLPFDGDDGKPARANGAKAALAALERGPGAPKPQVAAANEGKDPSAPTGEGDPEPQTSAVAPDAEAPEAKRVGIPTQPEKGGLHASEIAAFDPKGPAPTPAATRPAGPSITGADVKAGVGVPTEPDRGGLSTLEKALHGVK